MLKAIILLANYGWMRIQVACTKDRAKKFRILSKFERKCDDILMTMK